MEPDIISDIKLPLCTVLESDKKKKKKKTSWILQSMALNQDVLRGIRMFSSSTRGLSSPLLCGSLSVCSFLPFLL